MGSRKYISRKDISASAFTPKPKPNILQTRAFSSGKHARSSELPKTDILQTRPFSTPSQKGSEPEVQPLPPESLEKASAFGFNGASIPLFAPAPVAPIQAKLTVGEAGDKYEQEADTVAARVVDQINTPQPQQTSASETVQREEIEEDEVREKPEVNSIQREDMLDEGKKEEYPKISQGEESEHIQRTIHEWDGTNWTVFSSTTADTDGFPLPSNPPPEGVIVGDKYDQNTGEYIPNQEVLEEQIESVGNSKKKEFGRWFGKERHETGHGMLIGEPENNGPHSFSHIGKRTMAEMSQKRNPNFDPTKLKKTKLIPRPGQQKAIIKEYEEKTGKKLDKENKKRFLEEYQGKYDEIGTQKSKKAKNEGVTAAMELALPGTYALGREVTKEEIKGKGENRKKAAQDLLKLTNMKKGDAIPDKLETFDEGAIKEGGYDEDLMAQYLRGVGVVALGGYPSPLHGYDTPESSDTSESEDIEETSDKEEDKEEEKEE